MSEASHPSAWFPEVTQRLVDLNASMITGRPRDAGFDSELDHEITFLEHATTQLKRLRNAQKPLLRLPPEVLASIADILTDAWPAFRSLYEEERIEYDSEDSGVGPASPRDKRLSLGWILLGHVSFALRDMLLSRKVLWARVVTRNLRARNTILERCGETPLHLLMEGIHAVKRAQSTLEFILEHIPRAHTVNISSLSNSSAVALFDPAQLLQKPMPHLVDLRIWLPHDRRRLQLLSADVLTLPVLDAPQLTSVNFHNFILPMLFSNLAHVTITFSPRFDALSVDYIMKILSQSETLEALTLEYCLPVLPIANTAYGPQLPRLRSVCLRDEAHRVFAGWMYIHAFRPSARFILHFGDELPRASEPTPIPITLQGNVDGHITGLCIYDKEGETSWGPILSWDDDFDGMATYVLSFFAPKDGATLHDYRFNRGDDRFKNGFERRLTTTFEKYAGEVLPYEVLKSLVSIVDFSVVTTLSLDAAALTRPWSDWVEIFHSLVELDTLFLRVGHKSIILALTPSTEPTPLLPRLRLLWISELRFSKRHGDTATDVPLNGISTYTQMVQERAQRGAALQHLRIDNLYMDKDMVDNVFIPRMKLFVPTVQCTIVTPSGSSYGFTAVSAPTNFMQGSLSSESDSDSDSESSG